jgi:SAM-dependent methyltransferase
LILVIITARNSTESRVLEIGPATGQATLPLAQLANPYITAVELGGKLAVVAQRNLAAFTNVKIVIDDFEEWPLPTQKFDLVLAATAWHWINPDVRVRKSAEALRKSGYLAVIETYHIKGGSLDFFKKVQGLYNRYGLARWPEDDELPEAKDIREPSFEQDFGGDTFTKLQFQRYEWDQDFTTERYLGLLSTYSNHIALGDEARTRFFDEIKVMIKGKYGSKVVKCFLVQLVIVKKS